MTSSCLIRRHYPESPFAPIPETHWGQPLPSASSLVPLSNFSWLLSMSHLRLLPIPASTPSLPLDLALHSIFTLSPVRSGHPPPWVLSFFFHFPARLSSHASPVSFPLLVFSPDCISISSTSNDLQRLTVDARSLVSRRRVT